MDGQHSVESSPSEGGRHNRVSSIFECWKGLKDVPGPSCVLQSVFSETRTAAHMVILVVIISRIGPIARLLGFTTTPRSPDRLVNRPLPYCLPPAGLPHADSVYHWQLVSNGSQQGLQTADLCPHVCTFLVGPFCVVALQPPSLLLSPRTYNGPTLDAIGRLLVLAAAGVYRQQTTFVVPPPPCPCTSGTGQPCAGK